MALTDNRSALVHTRDPRELTGYKFAIDLDLVRLHRLLDRPSNLSQTCVNACFLSRHGNTISSRRCCAAWNTVTYPDTSLGGGLHGFKELVKFVVEVQCERRVEDAALHVHTKVDLQNVAALQDW